MKIPSPHCHSLPSLLRPMAVANSADCLAELAVAALVDVPGACSDQDLICGLIANACKSRTQHLKDLPPRAAAGSRPTGGHRPSTVVKEPRGLLRCTMGWGAGKGKVTPAAVQKPYLKAGTTWTKPQSIPARGTVGTAGVRPGYRPARPAGPTGAAPAGWASQGSWSGKGQSSPSGPQHDKVPEVGIAP
eukprot:s655_g3.t1